MKDIKQLAKDTPDICFYYLISRSQRKTEEERGEGTAGTKGFEESGCYECDGFSRTCPKYERIGDFY